MSASSDITRSMAAELGLSAAQFADLMEAGRILLDRCGNLSVATQ